MRVAWKVAGLAAGIFALADAWGPDRIGVVGAREEPKPVKSVRGGAVATTARHRFEVFFYATGLRVFPQDAAGVPIDASRLSGTATFYHPNSPRPWFSRPLRGATAAPGQASASLDLALGLSQVPPVGAKVAFEIAGLADPAEGQVSFTVPFERVTTATPPQPSRPQGGAAPAPSPRYTYGPGYYGYGYYRQQGYVSPPAGSPGGVRDRAPGRHATHSGPPRTLLDWAAWRENPIAKPWLRPMD